MNAIADVVPFLLSSEACYESFSPGLHNLPHMGEVIAHYRKKRYRTQESFAIAAGVIVRTVQEWETNIMTADMGRRIFLAKMLKIPPCLTWVRLATSRLREQSRRVYRPALL